MDYVLVEGRNVDIETSNRRVTNLSVKYVRVVVNVVGQQVVRRPDDDGVAVVAVPQPSDAKRPDRLVDVEKGHVLDLARRAGEAVARRAQLVVRRVDKDLLGCGRAAQRRVLAVEQPDRHLAREDGHVQVEVVSCLHGARELHTGARAKNTIDEYKKIRHDITFFFEDRKRKPVCMVKSKGLEGSVVMPKKKIENDQLKTKRLKRRLKTKKNED